jgi:hypothetical protein
VIRNTSPPDSRGDLGVFCTHFDNHAIVPARLEKLLYPGLSRSLSGCFKPLMDPGGGFTSKTEIGARRFQN